MKEKKEINKTIRLDDRRNQELSKWLKDNTAELESKINQLPDIDAAKLVRLHNLIVADGFQVNFERLADKLLDFETKM
jgi:anti-sigma28 factor (negative regulator of flagellin synthesis)